MTLTRFVLTVIFILQSCCLSFATNTPLMANTRAANLAAQYYWLSGNNGSGAVENRNVFVVPTNGRLRNLRVSLTAAPGEGNTWTFLTRQNGGNGNITCSIGGAFNTTGSDIYASTNREDVVSAGDLCALVVSGSGNNALPTWSIEFISDTTGETVVTGGGYISATSYGAITAYQSDSTANYSYIPIPCNGKLKKLFVKLTTAPGAGDPVKSWDATLYYDDNPKELKCNIATAATTGNDTTHEVDVTTGKLACLLFTANNTPATTYIRYSMVFVGSTAGDFILGSPHANIGTPANNSNEFNALSGTPTATDWSSTEDQSQQISCVNWYAKTIYAQLITAPGDSKSYTFGLSINAGGMSSLAAILTGAAPSPMQASDIESAGMLISAGNLACVMSTPFGSPTASDVMYGICGNVNAPSTTLTVDPCILTLTLPDVTLNGPYYGGGISPGLGLNGQFPFWMQRPR